MTHYNGKLCHKHPNSFGQRYINGDDCVACSKDRAIVRKKAPNLHSKAMCTNCATLVRFNGCLLCYVCWKANKVALERMPNQKQVMEAERQIAYERLKNDLYEFVIVDHLDLVVK